MFVFYQHNFADLVQQIPCIRMVQLYNPMESMTDETPRGIIITSDYFVEFLHIHAMYTLLRRDVYSTTSCT